MENGGSNFDLFDSAFDSQFTRGQITTTTSHNNGYANAQSDHITYPAPIPPSGGWFNTYQREHTQSFNSDDSSSLSNAHELSTSETSSQCSSEYPNYGHGGDLSLEANFPSPSEFNSLNISSSSHQQNQYAMLEQQQQAFFPAVPDSQADVKPFPTSTQEGDDVPEADPNHPRCPICGDLAGKHFYYGVQTCIGCRGFFQRSVRNRFHQNFVCLTGDKSCEITARSRKNCKKCRFDKCVSKGMKIAYVLTPPGSNVGTVSAAKGSSTARCMKALAAAKQQGVSGSQIYQISTQFTEQEVEDVTRHYTVRVPPHLILSGALAK